MKLLLYGCIKNLTIILSFTKNTIKMKTFLIVSFCSLLTGMIYAQENNYLVYSIKGNVTLVENKTESKIKIGKMLNSSATIKVANGAMVTLFCNEVAMFSIKKPGTYSVSQFSDSCRINQSSVSANYIKYVWAQMT